MIQNDSAEMSTFEVRISTRAWTRLANAPVPRSIDDQGGRLFGVDKALRYAVIRYLCQDQALLSVKPGTRSPVTLLHLSLPRDLYTVLEERAAAEQRSRGGWQKSVSAVCSSGGARLKLRCALGFRRIRWCVLLTLC